MPSNICVPLYKSAQPDLTVRTSADVVGKTFAAVSGDIQSGPVITTAVLPSTYDGGNVVMGTCAAGLQPDGVFAYDALSGTVVPVVRPGGTYPITAGANITAGVEVEVGALGKAIPKASGIAVGKAIKTVLSGADAFIELY